MTGTTNAVHMQKDLDLSGFQLKSNECNRSKLWPAPEFTILYLRRFENTHLHSVMVSAGSSSRMGRPSVRSAAALKLPSTLFVDLAIALIPA